jgi:quinol monooxygenase YgiN
VIVYEVNLRVQRTIAAAYLSWLESHVAQMLALPGFVSAQTFTAPDHEDEQVRAFCVQYRLQDRAALDGYLREHAARMRADAVARFGDRFSAGRRVLEPLAS